MRQFVKVSVISANKQGEKRKLNHPYDSKSRGVKENGGKTDKAVC